MLVKFEAYRDNGQWGAQGIGIGVFTQGQSFEGLLENIEEALTLHFQEKLEKGETVQVLILMETEIKAKLHLHRPKRASAHLSAKEAQRRKALVERILKMREGLPPLDITTAELVRLAREERNWLYES